MKRTLPWIGASPVYPHLTEKDILDALRRRHSELSQGGPQQRWVFVTHVRVIPGFDTPRVLDAFALDTWPSNRYYRVAYEVKVSRGDLHQELAHPEKRAFALAVSNRFYFAVPDGMKGEDGLPEEAGLIWVRANGSTRIVKEAPLRSPGAMSMDFMVSLLRTYQGEKRRE